MSSREVVLAEVISGGTLTEVAERRVELSEHQRRRSRLLVEREGVGIQREAAVVEAKGPLMLARVGELLCRYLEVEPLLAGMRLAEAAVEGFAYG